MENFGYLTGQAYIRNLKTNKLGQKMLFGEIVVSLSVTVIFYHKTRISEEEPPLFVIIEAISLTPLLANTGKAFACFIKRKNTKSEKGCCNYLYII